MDALLFDLDGTLVDTAPDLARALNQARLEEGLPPLPFDLIREQVSEGAQALIQLGFGLGVECDQYTPLRNRLLDYYECNICEHSRLFPGIHELLDRLDQKRIPWGIVTNKPRHLSENLLHQLNLSQRCSVLVCPEDVVNKKPAPDALYQAAKKIQLRPECVFYVGDHERDIQAAKAAGMPSVAVGYGYIRADDTVECWGADFTFHTSESFADWAMRHFTGQAS